MCTPGCVDGGLPVGPWLNLNAWVVRGPSGLRAQKDVDRGASWWPRRYGVASAAAVTGEIDVTTFAQRGLHDQQLERR
jgi:hypothetical protein